MKEKKNNSPQSHTDIDINTDENISGATYLDEPLGEGAIFDKSREDKLITELAELQDKFLRKVAEFDNFKRRSAKERIELIQTAGRDVITDLLDVLDDCDRAQKQLESSASPEQIREGVMLVFNKLRNTLQGKGLKAMETIHTEFDPDLHDALTEIPAPDEEQKGKVLDEVMKGYYLNDKIIRHAKVVVGK